MPVCECGIVAWCNSVIATCALALLLDLGSFFLPRFLAAPDCDVSCPYCDTCDACPTCAAAAAAGDEGAGVCNTTAYPEFAGDDEACSYLLLDLLGNLASLVFFILLPLFIHRFKPRLGPQLTKTMLTCWAVLAVPALLNAAAAAFIEMSVPWLRMLRPLRSLVIMMVIYHTNRVKQAAVREADGDESLLLNERYSLWREVTPAGRVGQFTVGGGGGGGEAEEALSASIPPP
eukprot:COSAG06_NODE_2116_length_7557_cov_122.672298_2_plen_232_part_00